MKIFVSSTHAHSSAAKMFEIGSDLLTQSHTRSQPTISSNNIGLVFFAGLLKKDYNADDRRCINYSSHLFDKMIIMIIYDMMIIHDHDSDMALYVEQCTGTTPYARHVHPC